MIVRAERQLLTDGHLTFKRNPPVDRHPDRPGAG